MGIATLNPSYDTELMKDREAEVLGGQLGAHEYGMRLSACSLSAKTFSRS